MGRSQAQGRGGGRQGLHCGEANPNQKLGEKNKTRTRNWGGPQVRDPVPIVSVNPEADPPQPRAPVQPNRAERDGHQRRSSFIQEGNWRQAQAEAGHKPPNSVRPLETRAHSFARVAALFTKFRAGMTQHVRIHRLVTHFPLNSLQLPQNAGGGWQRSHTHMMQESVCTKQVPVR